MSDTQRPLSIFQRLALEYVKAHISEAETPEAVYVMYADAYERIKAAYSTSRRTQASDS